MVAHGVSRGYVWKSTGPWKGKNNYLVHRSFAAPRLGSYDTFPTARAVGYHLPPLRG
jgi:hypothetical protein